MLHSTRTLIAACLLFSMAGCVGKQTKANKAEQVPATEPSAATAAPTEPVPLDLNKLLKPGEQPLEDAYYTQPAAYEKGLGVHARADGNVLFVSMHNKTRRDIALIPKDFALLKGRNPQTDLIFLNPQTADMKTFPAVMIKSGEQFSFRLRMTSAASLRGMALFYNNPRDGIKLVVPVE